MKKCPKTQPEPVELFAFRGSNPKGTWDQFRNLSASAYATIRDIARSDQCGLCAYCEIKLERENEQIAHFHPKSDASGPCNWALDWANLWLACKGGDQAWMTNPHYYLPPLPDNLSCDVFKGDKILDNLVFAPHELPAFPRVFKFVQISDGIEISVDAEACISVGIDPAKVQLTIDHFNLNCTRLLMARLAVHKQIEQAIGRLRDSHIDPKIGLNSLVERHLEKDTNGCWTQFFTLVRWRFKERADRYLQSINYQG